MACPPGRVTRVGASRATPNPAADAATTWATFTDCYAVLGAQPQRTPALWNRIRCRRRAKPVASLRPLAARRVRARGALPAHCLWQFGPGCLGLRTIWHRSSRETSCECSQYPHLSGPRAPGRRRYRRRALVDRTSRSVTRRPGSGVDAGHDPCRHSLGYEARPATSRTSVGTHASSRHYQNARAAAGGADPRSGRWAQRRAFGFRTTCWE